MTTLNIVCPRDKSRLIIEKNIAHCPKCTINYSRINGIWQLYQPDNLIVKENDVVDWFDKRADNIHDEQFLRGIPDQWHKKFFATDIVNIGKYLKLNNKDCLLDIGCGNGLFLQAYMHQVKQAAGTDISIKMLKHAKKQLNDANTFLAQADSLHLPFDSGSFDAIICNWMLHYFTKEQIPQFFAELKRVGKKDARIFIGEIPLKHSLRNYEAAVGHFLVDKINLKVSDRFISPVKTTKFTKKEIENWTKTTGIKIIAKGTMRHVLPSIRIPYVGALVPNTVQHLFSRYDYRGSIPLISYSYFVVLSP